MISYYFLLLMIAPYSLSGEIQPNGSVKLFSDEFTHILSKQLISCARDIEFNYQFQESQGLDTIVDFHRCATYDDLQSCRCAFLKEVKLGCNVEDNNLWYIDNQITMSCQAADMLEIEQEEELDEYLKKVENELKLQNLTKHQQEVKFIDINKRGELYAFAKSTDSQGEEFNWNSYSAEDNVGPALELNEQLTHELEIDLLEKELNSATVQGDQILKRDAMMKEKKAERRIIVKATTLSSPTKTTVIFLTTTKEVTTTITDKPTTVVSTESYTRYIKTSVVTERETYEIFDLTKTEEKTVEVTKTMVHRKTRTITEYLTTRPTPTLANTVELSYALPKTTGSANKTMTVRLDWPIPSIPRSPPKKAALETMATYGRTRNGSYQQKLLAQKNLRVQKRDNVTLQNDLEVSTSLGGKLSKMSSCLIIVVVILWNL